MSSRGTAAATNDRAAVQYAYRVAVAEEQGWQAAVALCQRLGAGCPPPIVPGCSPEGEPVLLDTAFDCFSWLAAHVVPKQRPVVAFGPPVLVAAAVTLGAAAGRRARARAAAMSHPRWHTHGRCRVLVTAAATWCGWGGQWRCYRHDTLADYEVTEAGGTMWFVTDVPPVRLVGPAVWCHAVLLAYARYGPETYLQAPYLGPLRQLALESAASGV